MATHSHTQHSTEQGARGTVPAVLEQDSVGKDPLLWPPTRATSLTAVSPSPGKAEMPQQQGGWPHSAAEPGQENGMSQAWTRSWAAARASPPSTGTAETETKPQHQDSLGKGSSDVCLTPG